MDTTAVARRIGRLQPVDLPELLVSYAALGWLLIKQDGAIMDAEATGIRCVQ